MQLYFVANNFIIHSILIYIQDISMQRSAFFVKTTEVEQVHSIMVSVDERMFCFCNYSN